MYRPVNCCCQLNYLQASATYVQLILNNLGLSQYSTWTIEIMYVRLDCRELEVLVFYVLLKLSCVVDCCNFADT